MSKLTKQQKHYLSTASIGFVNGDWLTRSERQEFIEILDSGDLSGSRFAELNKLGFRRFVESFEKAHLSQEGYMNFIKGNWATK